MLKYQIPLSKTQEINLYLEISLFQIFHLHSNNKSSVNIGNFPYSLRLRSDWTIFYYGGHALAKICNTKHLVCSDYQQMHQRIWASKCYKTWGSPNSFDTSSNKQERENEKYGYRASHHSCWTKINYFDSQRPQASQSCFSRKALVRNRSRTTTGASHPFETI